MIVVIGDLVADLIVWGGAALERGTDNPAEVRLTRGGSAANVAAAAAPRHPSRFIGCVGDDTLGHALVGVDLDAGEVLLGVHLHAVDLEDGHPAVVPLDLDVLALAQ